MNNELSLVEALTPLNSLTDLLTSCFLGISES
jgi:hypothetical protein